MRNCLSIKHSLPKTLKEVRTGQETVRRTRDVGAGLVNNLSALIRENPALRGVEVQVGNGGGKEPPTGLESAFAAFDFGKDGRLRLLTIYDRDDNNWGGGGNGRSRRDFLKGASMEPWTFRAATTTAEERPQVRRFVIRSSDGVYNVIADDYQTGRRFLLYDTPDEKVVDLLDYRPGNLRLEMGRACCVPCWEENSMSEPDDRSASGWLVGIAFKGNTENEARAFHEALDAARPGQIRSLESLPSLPAHLAAGMVFITLVAASAVKAVMKVLIDAIEEEIERQAEAGSSSELQIKVELPDGRRRNFPPAAPAPMAGGFSWKVALQTLRELISKL